jgi:mono/diheme cytochrome c family protein
MTFRLPLLTLALCASFSIAHAQDAKAPYKVVDGYKVDANTMKGFRAWRSAACDRCHGPNQEGMVGPSLINSLKTLSKDEFVATVKNGRLDKGMPSFGTNAAVTDNIDQLYAYLKGRSDGAITRSKVEEAQ